jgi:hypothetical protein
MTSAGWRENSRRVCRRLERLFGRSYARGVSVGAPPDMLQPSSGQNLVPARHVGHPAGSRRCAIAAIPGHRSDRAAARRRDPRGPKPTACFRFVVDPRRARVPESGTYVHFNGLRGAQSASWPSQAQRAGSDRDRAKTRASFEPRVRGYLTERGIFRHVHPAGCETRPPMARIPAGAQPPVKGTDHASTAPTILPPDRRPHPGYRLAA